MEVRACEPGARPSLRGHSRLRACEPRTYLGEFASLRSIRSNARVCSLSRKCAAPKSERWSSRWPHASAGRGQTPMARRRSLVQALAGGGASTSLRSLRKSIAHLPRQSSTHRNSRSFDMPSSHIAASRPSLASALSIKPRPPTAQVRRDTSARTTISLDAVYPELRKFDREASNLTSEQ